MTTIKQEYRQYLAEKFKNQKIEKPLFFNGEIGLRYDLQVGETNTDEYFDEVVRRSSSLIEAVFDPNDVIFLVFRDFKWKRRKIRFTNYCFKQVNNLKREEITYTAITNLYENDIYNVAVLKLKFNRINYRNILTAIANTDFPPRQPRFKFFGSEEIYFINTTKDIIFHMYDDRGLDIIASEVETLIPVYKNFNNWILEINREKIDEIMSTH